MRGRQRGLRAGSVEDHAERIAAQDPDHRRGRPLGEPRGDVAEQRRSQLVADRAAQGLEPVDADRRRHRAGFARRGQRRQLRLQRAPIGQSGRGIAHRQFGELALAFVDRLGHRVEAIGQAAGLAAGVGRHAGRLAALQLARRILHRGQGVGEAPLPGREVEHVVRLIPATGEKAAKSAARRSVLSSTA